MVEGLLWAVFLLTYVTASTWIDKWGSRSHPTWPPYVDRWQL